MPNHRRTVGRHRRKGLVVFDRSSRAGSLSTLDTGYPCQLFLASLAGFTALVITIGWVSGGVSVTSADLPDVATVAAVFASDGPQLCGGQR